MYEDEDPGDSFCEPDGNGGGTGTDHCLSDDNDSQSSGEDVEMNEFIMKLPEEFLGPLYKGAAISVCATYCAIMEFASSTLLPYSAIEKLLQLLQLLCPPDNRLPTSIYKLKRFFRMFTQEYKKCEFCSCCGEELPCDHRCPPGLKTNVIVSPPLDKSLQVLIQSKNVAMYPSLHI